MTNYYQNAAKELTKIFTDSEVALPYAKAGIEVLYNRLQQGPLAGDAIEIAARMKLSISSQAWEEASEEIYGLLEAVVDTMESLYFMVAEFAGNDDARKYIIESAHNFNVQLQ